MRIIDKNTDYYDYYQNIYRDDTITFDRTDSFLLTKSMMCEHLSGTHWNRWDNDPYNFVLLQVCNTFWLFLTQITKRDEYNRTLDYTMELITTWKNYSKPRRLIKVDIISFLSDVRRLLRKKTDYSMYDKTAIVSRTDVLAQAIDSGNYKVCNSIDRHVIYKGSVGVFRGEQPKVEKHIPLLKACGVAGCVDPLEIYLAFEEYFSLEKSSHERTESVGLTDKEKITNHGFDVKTSFRGK